jgi:hypothetical protein
VSDKVLNSYTNDSRVYSLTVINDKYILLHAYEELKVIDLNTFKPVCE